MNVLVWAAQLFFDSQYGNISAGYLWLTDKIALYSVGIEQFRPYQIVTHMFAHSSYSQSGRIQFYHILFNMFALWMFGKELENRWGPQRFLFFYLTAGIGAALTHLLVQHLTGSESAAVGASGAVMGVMAAFGYLFPNTELYIFFIPFPIKAKWAVLGYVAVDLFGGIANISGDNVAHFAHLGGALTGFILVLIWNKTDRRRFY
ncbi:MAG TPA: rhomboid family intramembrane serine protease [Flavisolibacter sp.]|nr:rhomboid family intramembrane serine protease [Flavisolibacter sp.]